MWVRRLADAADGCGAKAANLARLIEAKLPVPDGFAIEAEAFRAIVGELPAHDAIGHALEEARQRIAAAPPDEEVISCARVLPGTIAVRSSASLEDAASGSAAGVFASSTNVPARDVWDAVRAVWTSALTSLAVTYARGRAAKGRQATIEMGVIVQRYVPGDLVTIYTRPPGQPDVRRVIAQRGQYVREYAADDVDPLVALALRAEAAIGATAGADVELVVDRTGEPWVVQARPIVHAPVVERVTPPPALYARLVAPHDPRRWTWDVAHNPDPLSPAQAGLVERVERANIAPWSMTLVAGYLYTAPRVAPPVVDLANFDERVRDIEARFAELVDDPQPLDVEAAIARYLAFYDVWANELSPLVAAARSTEAVTHRPSSVESTLRAAAHDMIDEATAIARLAPLAPAWDVAVPTFGERPEVIRAAIERARALPPPTTSIASTTLGQAAADLAERDDVWFAKAQWLVRRALLARGHQLGIPDEDICWLSLDDLGSDLDLDDARRRASAAKAAHARASKFAMPLVIDHRGPVASTGTPLRGHGSGARNVSGRVVHFASLASAVAVSSGDVIVTRAITPALAVFVVGCAAIVSETGGPLDHGAAIARELGIPFVVGCNDAWSLLRDGMRVTIDENLVIPTRN